MTLDADQHSVGLAALLHANESLERDGTSMATFRMPLDELRSRIRDNADNADNADLIPTTQDGNSVDDVAAHTDAVVQK